MPEQHDRRPVLTLLPPSLPPSLRPRPPPSLPSFSRTQTYNARKGLLSIYQRQWLEGARPAVLEPRYSNLSGFVFCPVYKVGSQTWQDFYREMRKRRSEERRRRGWQAVSATTKETFRRVLKRAVGMMTNGCVN